MAPLPSRSPHWLFHLPRAAAEERTSSGTPIGCDLQSRQRTAGCDWLARRHFSTSCPDWLPRAPLPVGPLTRLPASASHPQPFFFIREGRGRSGRGLERKRPMEAPPEGRVGGLCGRTGKSSANGRAPHIPGSGAPPLATHVLAGRTQGHARLDARRAGKAPTRMVGSLRRGRRGRPRAAIVACSGTAYVEARPPSGGAGTGP